MNIFGSIDSAGITLTVFGINRINNYMESSDIISQNLGIPFKSSEPTEIIKNKIT
jgi:hypothetical protein